MTQTLILPEARETESPIEAEIIPRDVSPASLIALAIDKGSDIDKLERLFDLEQRYNADKAKKAYYAAFSAFQAGAPPIPKSKDVKNRDGSPRYSYAPLDGILKVLRGPLKDNGFSWRFECLHTEDSLRVACLLTHVDGHSETSSVVVPLFAGQGTNAAQDEGSAMTYGKRYAFANATGVTIDEDNDGATAGPDNMPQILRQMAVFRKWYGSVFAIKQGLDDGGEIDTAAEAYAELTREELSALTSVAPTKGGIFTTEERAAMKGNEEFRAKVHILRTDAGWYEDNPT